MEAYSLELENSFSASTQSFIELIHKLNSDEVNNMQLRGLEALIQEDGREVLRNLLEETIKKQGPGDMGDSIEGSDNINRSHKRIRLIKTKTIFGEIQIERMIYSRPKHVSLAPKEASLNLPANSYSQGLQAFVAKESAKGSFDEAISSIEDFTGVKVPKRQAEAIAGHIAQDFDAFYEERSTSELRKITRKNDILALTTDGKGIVMRKDDLREATKKRAENEKKLSKRLSRGEKKNSKRMAQVASIYSIESNVRTVESILESSDSKKAQPPKPQAKRVWANVKNDSKDVINELFNEAKRRDPYQKRHWAILVDGQPYQLGLIEQELKERRVTGTIILDLIHVIEYLWKASRVFFQEDSKECESWVKHYLRMILDGRAQQAAAGMKRSATKQKITKRENVDICSNYLRNNAPYLKYNEYLNDGLPIATGVIEGACRYLVKDRMDVTGARWSLNGAEAILRLRSIHASGDWEAYLSFHFEQEYERNHKIHYARPERLRKPELTLVK